MAKKERTFVDKIRKQQMDFYKHCPVCGEPLKPVKVVASERSPRTGAWRFNTSIVMVCKCNSAEVFGG